MVTAKGVPPYLASEPVGTLKTASPQRPVLLRDLEAETILRVLRETGGNQVQAARLLGVDRKTIYRKVKKYRQSQMSP